VYVELPALPTWPIAETDAAAAKASVSGAATSRQDAAPSKHPWLANGLPVLNLAHTREQDVREAAIPFLLEASDRVRDAIAVLRLLLSTTSIPTESLTGDASPSALLALLGRAVVSDPNDAHSDVLAAFWARPECGGIPRTKLARQRFLQLWVNRTDFLHACHKHYKDVKRIGYGFVVRTIASALSGLLCVHVLARACACACVCVCGGGGGVTRFHTSRPCDNVVLSYVIVFCRKTDFIVDKVSSIPGFFERVGFAMLAECIMLCDAKLRRDWSNPSRHCLWTIRGAEADNFKLLCLDSNVTETYLDSPNATPRVAAYSPRPSSQPLSWNDYLQQPMGKRVEGLRDFALLKAELDRPSAALSLRSVMAPAYGLADSKVFTRLLRKKGYVLSTDFAVKLLILNERRRVRANVILSGDTGVGKSELFSTFATVVNADSDIIPDLPRELLRSLQCLRKAHAQNPAFARLGSAIDAVSDSVDSDGAADVLVNLLMSSIDWDSDPALLELVGDAIARYFFCLFVHFPVMELSPGIHEIFANLVRNVRWEKALAANHDVSAAEAAVAAQKKQDDDHESVFSYKMGGKHNITAAKAADALSILRRRWCQQLGLCSLPGRFGEWSSPKDAPSRLDDSAAAKLASSKTQLFPTKSALFDFVKVRCCSYDLRYSSCPAHCIREFVLTDLHLG
jgi:hypothetical protein